MSRPNLACGVGGILISALLGPVSPGAHAAESVEEGWRLIASGRASEAASAFAEPGESGMPEARLGQVLAELGSRSVTPSQLGAMLTTLEELGRVPGEVGVAALYFAGRLREYHMPSQGAHEAKAHYASVIEADAESPFAEWVSVREAVRALYLASSPEELRVRQTEAETLAGRLSHGLARRNLHLQLARAAERLELGAAVAYRHYRESDRLGLAQPSARALVLARLGELAAGLDERTAAIGYYRRFMAEFPRDERASAVQARLSELERVP